MTMVATLTRLTKIVRILAVSMASLTSREPYAADVRTLAITHNGDSYDIIFDAVAKAPAPLVYKILSDYGHLDKVSSVITQITVHPAPTGPGERVRSVPQSCFLLVCQKIVQVEDVTEPDNHTIVAHMVPGQGDFVDGHCMWHITEDGGQTRLHYEATRRIAFWIPPLIGSWIIMHTMREDLESSVTTLERMATQIAESRH